MVNMRDSAKLTVECPKCGESTEQTVGWLADHDRLACVHCGFSIDLEVSNDRARAQEFDKVCTQLDRNFSKIG